MSAENWLRALEVWKKLKDLSPEDRVQFLDEECGSDEGLRRLILEIEASDQLRRPDDPSTLLRADDLLGPYRILKLLGQGGMGQVYLAIRTDDPKLRVDAVKIVPTGQLTTEHVARAAREAEQLRALGEDSEKATFPEYRDHGRLPDGRPYLAMEYIDGLPLDDYCSQNDLGLRERLRLVIRICDAVSVAHRAAILHRDLKPTNILVTPDGVPWILDFGMAKDIPQGGLTRHTLTAAFAPHFSRNYASPELLAEEELTTGSDVYSVGVMLYRLLTSRLPIDLDGVPLKDLYQVVLDTSVRRPSESFLDGEGGKSDKAKQWGKAVKGDLDVIALKAIHKEPRHRYETPEQLASDLELHLASRPIKARPPTRRYRFRKFLQRNKGPVAVSIAFLLLLVISASALGRQYGETALERDRAEAISDFLIGIIAEANPFRASTSEPSLTDLLQEAGTRLSTHFGDQPRIRAQLYTMITESHLGIGNLDEAEQMASEALAEARREIPSDRTVHADLLSNLGQAAFFKGNYSKALRRFGEALSLREQEYGLDHMETAESISSTGLVYERLDRLHASETAHRESLRIRQAITSPGSIEIGVGYTNLGALMRSLDRLDEAEQYQRTALDIYERELGLRHPRTARVQSNLAVVLGSLGRLDEQVALLESTIDTKISILGPKHPSVASSLHTLGGAFAGLRRYDEAREVLEEALSIREKHLDPDNTLLANTLSNLGATYSGLGELELAETCYARSLSIFQENYGPDHLRLNVVRGNLASVLRKQGRLADALSYLNSAKESLQRTNREQTYYMSIVLNGIATNHFLSGRLAEADELFSEAVALREETRGPNHITLAKVLENHSRVLDAMGRADEAERLRARQASIEAQFDD